LGNLLDRIHKRVHPLFADQYLSSFHALPSDSPALEITLRVQIEPHLVQRTGEIEASGICRRSASEEFYIAG